MKSMVEDLKKEKKTLLEKLNKSDSDKNVIINNN